MSAVSLSCEIPLVRNTVDDGSSTMTSPRCVDAHRVTERTPHADNNAHNGLANELDGRVSCDADATGLGCSSTLLCVNPLRNPTTLSDNDPTDITSELNIVKHNSLNEGELIIPNRQPKVETKSR